MSEPHIRLALLGAGIFVKDAYIPLLRRALSMNTELVAQSFRLCHCPACIPGTSCFYTQAY